MKSQPITQQQTPKALGYFMPPEWAPHEGTWLSWPKDPITWPDRVPQVEKIYEQMIEALAQNEKVFLLVDDEAMQASVYQRLKTRGVKLENICFYLIPTVDAWTRDYGPNFLLKEGEIAMNHWTFNAWGGKYEELKQDTNIPKILEKELNLLRFVPNIILEGGSIDVNGAGTVLTTEQCLLNTNRNPKLSREQIENYLQDYLGVHRVLWLGEGIVGDDTDGHVDDITRFVSQDTIITALEENKHDPNYEILQNNFSRLKAATTPNGKKWNLIALPMPDPVEDSQGRLPASYANFYIANNVVLVPLYQCPKDERALAILKELFPKRKIIGIQCEPLIHGLGAIHCVTQQQPRGIPFHG